VTSADNTFRVLGTIPAATESLFVNIQSRGVSPTVCRMEQRVRHDLSYASLMKPQQVKLALAAVWMLLAVVIIAASGYLRSTSDVLMLAVFAVAPPAAVWFWWNDPVQTLSQSIQAVRRNDTGKTTRR
jgi:hypothetical protein